MFCYYSVSKPFGESRVFKFECVYGVGVCERLGRKPSVESCRESGNHEVIKWSSVAWEREEKALRFV